MKFHIGILMSVVTMYSGIYSADATTAAAAATATGSASEPSSPAALVATRSRAGSAASPGGRVQRGSVVRALIKSARSSEYDENVGTGSYSTLRRLTTGGPGRPSQDAQEKSKHDAASKNAASNQPQPTTPSCLSCQLQRGMIETLECHASDRDFLKELVAKLQQENQQLQQRLIKPTAVDASTQTD
ncbi:MAG TPA: hypothetical protein VLG71_00080 [Candidatus Limnocylindria bacterium]|nr:hypothetical protein [Candidatus Limnocylindria bacterium]